MAVTAGIAERTPNVRLVARGGHDPSLGGIAYGNRTPSQRRIVALFHRRVEGVHVDVDNFTNRQIRHASDHSSQGTQEEPPECLNLNLHWAVWPSDCGTRAGGCSLRQAITVATKTKLEESLMIATPRYVHPEAIVSTEWLAEHLPDPALRIYDCTSY